MYKELSIEINPEDRSLAEDILAQHNIEPEIIEEKNLTGAEIIIFIIPLIPSTINASISIYNTFFKNDKKIVVVLPGGKRIENVSEAELNKILSEYEQTPNNGE